MATTPTPAAKPVLTLDELKRTAVAFLRTVSGQPVAVLYGVTDGKAVGTYVEHLFHDYLTANYTYVRGNSASGIDFPALLVDLKVTSIRQPQSSSPFAAASQKVYGLGYHLMVFVYDKVDDPATATSTLTFTNAAFVSQERTGDFQLTRQILDFMARAGNRDDLIALMEDRNLPLDDIGRGQLADRILQDPPIQGFLTISNALQWRLQYGRVLTVATAGATAGVENLLV